MSFLNGPQGLSTNSGVVLNRIGPKSILQAALIDLLLVGFALSLPLPLSLSFSLSLSPSTHISLSLSLTVHSVAQAPQCGISVEVLVLHISDMEH